MAKWSHNDPEDAQALPRRVQSWLARLPYREALEPVRYRVGDREYTNATVALTADGELEVLIDGQWRVATRLA